MGVSLDAFGEVFKTCIKWYGGWRGRRSVTGAHRCQRSRPAPSGGTAEAETGTLRPPQRPGRGLPPNPRRARPEPAAAAPRGPGRARPGPPARLPRLSLRAAAEEAGRSGGAGAVPQLPVVALLLQAGPARLRHRRAHPCAQARRCAGACAGVGPPPAPGGVACGGVRHHAASSRMARGRCCGGVLRWRRCALCGWTVRGHEKRGAEAGSPPGAAHPSAMPPRLPKGAPNEPLLPFAPYCSRVFSLANFLLILRMCFLSFPSQSLLHLGTFPPPALTPDGDSQQWTWSSFPPNRRASLRSAGRSGPALGSWS